MDSSAVLVWLLYASVGLVLLLLSAFLVLYAQPKHGASSSLAAFAGTSTLSAAPLTVSSRFVNVVCIAALYLSLLCLFTAPVDVYLLENALPHVPANVRALKVLYRVYFAALALYSFVGAPLAYNYAKQTEIAHLTLKFSTKQRLYAALKRTACFLLGLSLLLVMVMVVLLCGKPASSDVDWLKPLLKFSSDLETFLRLLVGILALTGMYLWIFVCSRGLASVPLVGFLMEDHSIDENMSTFEELLRENTMEAQATHQTKETILQRYAVEQKMSGADQERLSQLKTREQLLEERREVLKANLQRFALSGKLSCWKIPVGVVLMLLSLLIVISMLITSIDKMAHSNFERGFLLNAPEFPNPMDLLLVLASRVFPLDYVVFAVLFVYLFGISLIVLKRQGLQFLCFRLGKLQPRLTSAATMTMLSLVMMQLAMVGLFSLLTLAPQYTTFGHQVFADASGRVTPCTLEEAAKAAAAAAEAGTLPSHCRMTQLARFFNGLAVELPMFGTAFFVGQFLFAAAFVPWITHAYCMAKKLDEPVDPKRQRLLDDF
ncbi:putative lysosomal cobalamin transporter [Phytophthora boehmeriae]|uniref:Putative lysosomal cobalamin transporter n=1 Tax=Phytophthora boehmeriae TaxID=109152 RepID=A0A8T1WCT9_9STRA|nr:putative lysosomal cobalamin transporter [Phytophthora boehmeriae]